MSERKLATIRRIAEVKAIDGSFSFKAISNRYLLKQKD